MKKKEVKRAVVDPREIIEAHCSDLVHLIKKEAEYERVRFQEDLNISQELQEKRGRALYRLHLSDWKFNPSGHRLLTFSPQNRRYLPKNTFRPGEVVRLLGTRTPDKDQPVGTVYETELERITVAFPLNVPKWVGRERQYHLKACRNQTTYERMLEAIHLVREAKHNKLAVMRDISLGLRDPEMKDPVSESKIDFVQQLLNKKQREAVRMFLETEDILLIHGPPGTGKTRVLIELIMQARKADQNVIVSAPSNAACDHIVECLAALGQKVMRLGHPARVNEVLRSHTLSYRLMQHPLANVIHENETNVEQLYRQIDRRQERRVMTREAKDESYQEIRSLKQDIRNIRSQIIQQVWSDADIIVATHTAAGDPQLLTRRFDWVIIDEATQGVEPSTWIPIARGDRIVLAGDHRQLAPTVFSPARLRDKDLRHTLFERLVRVLPASSKIKLQEQYRMNESIMSYPSQEFYDNELEAAESIAKLRLSNLPGVHLSDDLDGPFVFLDTAGLGYEEKQEEGGASRINEEEARLVLREVLLLIKAGISPADIAVISPYSAQVKLLSQNLMQHPEASGVEVDTIDAFQGREREVVIVSLVRSNLRGEIGFLEDVRRMNVAITRAKKRLVVIGDSATVSTFQFFRALIEYAEKIGGYRSAWEYKDV